MDARQTLIDCGRQFYERQWMCGMSGNLSVRLRRTPLAFAITPKGVNKGNLAARDLLTIEDGKPRRPHPRGLVPSSETAVHQAVYRAVPEAGAVFHVHPIYPTLISRLYGHPTQVRLLKLEGIMMMKGITGLEEDRAELAILPSWKDANHIAKDLTLYVRRAKKRVLPAVLIYDHGLTGWGVTPDQARNHLEIIEYTCQYLFLKKLTKQR